MHTGDRLEWTTPAGDVRTARCRGVEIMNQRPPMTPPSIGLTVSDAEPSDFATNTIITVSCAV